MDADALRDRIAKVHIAATARMAAEQMGLESPVTWDDISEADKEVCLAGAQAVIDDLGLTVETATLYGVRENGLPFTGTRVVGKWEAEK